MFCALSYILPGECADPIVQDLLVESVTPAPDASRLLVRVHLSTLAGQVGSAEVLTRLAGVHGFLRAQVATAVHRRKAPELMFQVLSCDHVLPREP